jgi:hypothetical protein
MGSRSMTPEQNRLGYIRRFLGSILAATIATTSSLPTAFAQPPAHPPASSSPSSSPSTPPPSAEELKQARELFQEAYRDEQEKRFADALDKFQRVAKVKESASVRYRIAACLAALGRLREARDMYRALAASRDSLPASDRETADSAAEKAAELDRRIPKLILKVNPNPPPDARVSIDGAPVPISANTTSRPIELDPGDHVVAASARTGTPTEQTVKLQDGGGEVTHTVMFPVDPAGAGNNGNNGGNNNGNPVQETPGPRSKRDTTLGVIAIGGGALLVLVGGAFLIAREGAIDNINATCPNKLCPLGKRDDVESDKDNAELFGPLGVGLGIVGLAAVGVGIYLLVRRPPARTAGGSGNLAFPGKDGLTTSHPYLNVSRQGGLIPSFAVSF